MNNQLTKREQFILSITNSLIAHHGMVAQRHLDNVEDWDQIIENAILFSDRIINEVDNSEKELT